MADGMYVKDVFVKNVFKNNLEDSYDEAKEDMEYIEKQILSYVMASPEMMKSEFEELGMVGIINTISELLNEYQDSTWRYRMIQTAKTFPEDVEYDL